MFPIVFRFKILPFLKEQILPKYKENLRKEGNSTIIFTDDEHAILEKYALFLSFVYNKEICVIKKEIDINEMHTFFEVMEKHVNIFLKTMRQAVLDEHDKRDIVSQFETAARPYVAHILS
jgi:hypothetical protein